MSRQRKQRGESDRAPPIKKSQVSNSSHSGKSRKEKTSLFALGTKALVAFILVCVISVALGIYLYTQYLENRVATQLNVPRVVTQDGLEVPEKYWGSYRPAVYFAMKTRSPNSPTMGLMWFQQKVVNNQLPLRYWCELADYNQRYSWLEHDGENFGLQKIYDDDVVITTSFVKRQGGDDGGDWSARITALPVSSKKQSAALSLLFYVALDGNGVLEPHVRGNTLEGVTGETSSTGRFRMSFLHNNTNVLMLNYLSTTSKGLDSLKEVVISSLAYFSDEKDTKRYIGLIGDKFHVGTSERRPDFVVYQATVAVPFEMEVTFESGSFRERPNSLSDDVYTSLLENYRRKFDEKFENVFHLKKANYGTKEVEFAKAALSNMIGSIGYFYGRSIVQSRHNTQPIAYFEAPLYTAVPSRSTFPRGFLWDEGFHDLLISRWDIDMVKDILGHWLDLMNDDGWIPREQVLDRESRSRIPPEYLVQWDTNANPPTLFLPFKMLLKRMTESSDQVSASDRQFLARAYPRLKVWYNWFNTSQIGKIRSSYYWHGRHDENREELNPLTLMSGLDDYPRASNPTDDERHVDLRCWMALAAGVMADIAKVLGEPASEYAATYGYLADNALLDELHWSRELEAYADFGLHSNKVLLEKPKPKPHQPGTPAPSNNPVRVYVEQPKLQFVNAFGYVSLFPFFLHILEPTSEKLGKVLDDISNRTLLWTDYGLRSLATTSDYYAKSNTPTNPPYWRGSIWINMNFLAVQALQHYATVKGPFKAKAKELHQELRANLMKNMVKQYYDSGYIWEQYNDKTGAGLRAHPFTGWSALITLIMAE